MWTKTGYGVQTDLLCRALIAAGHEPAVSAYYGPQGGMLIWEGVPHYPAPYEVWGNDVLLAHAKHHFGGQFTDGLIVTLVDAHVLNVDVLQQAHVVCWAPVDHDPVPPPVLRVLAESGCQPAAMSRHAERAMTEAGLTPVYLPHGVDVDVYQPRDRAAVRDNLTVPQQAFLVGMVCANKGHPSRKSIPEAVAAFARFAEAHDDAVLYLHTEPDGRFSGLKIGPLLAAHGLPPDRVRLTDPYIGHVLGVDGAFMADLYSACDVLLNPSRGEGFGVPVLEAAACGTPSIVTDWTAMPEVAGAAGFLVAGDRLFTEQESFQKVPSVDAIHIALEHAYQQAGGRRGLAVEHAQQYDYRRVYAEHWAPLLELMAARMEPVKAPRKSRAKVKATS